MSYIPSMTQRLGQLWDAWKHIRSPPPMAFQDGDVLVVCNPIDAYRNLITPAVTQSIQNLMKRAELEGVPVIITRWNRCDKSLNDAIDKRGHWTLYIPKEERCILREVATACTPTAVIPVDFTNAWHHEEFRNALHGYNRVVFAGTWTESCIRDTAKGAVEENKDIALVENACIGHGLLHTIALLGIQMSIGDVVCHHE